MYSLEILIASTLLAGIVSALFVHWINRSSGAKQHAQNLEQELSETKASYEAYRQEVFEDFSETASKFRTLNASYTELHQHLAQSANNLCGETNTISLLESPDSQDTDLSSDNTAFSEQRDSEALVAEESNLESSIVSDIQDPVADKAEVSTSTTDNTSTEEQAQDSKLDTDPVTGPIRESASSSLTDSSEIDLSKEINLQDIESLIQVDLVNSSGPTVDEQDTQQEATPDPTKKQSA